MAKAAAHPGLYDPDDAEPCLLGSACSACGAAYFPPLGLGCETCGAPAAALGATRLSATGVIHSVATVHRHAGHDIEAPFAVAEVQLDDGPLIRCTLVDVVEPEAIGARVAARWFVTATADDGADVVEPRFAVVES